MKHLNRQQIDRLIEEGGAQHPEWMGHIEHCEQCRVEYEKELAVHQSLQQLDYHRPSMRFAKNVLDLLERSQKARRASAFWMQFTSYALIAALALSLVMLGFLYTRMDESFFVQEEWLSTMIQWSLLMLYAVGAFIFFYVLDRWLGKRVS